MAAPTPTSAPLSSPTAPSRRRPFTTWVRKLTSFTKPPSPPPPPIRPPHRNPSRHRAESTPAPHAHNPPRRPKLSHHLKPKKPPKNNNPYPQSALLTQLTRHPPQTSSLPSFFSHGPVAPSVASGESSLIELATRGGPIPNVADSLFSTATGISDNASIAAIRPTSSDTILPPTPDPSNSLNSTSTLRTTPPSPSRPSSTFSYRPPSTPSLATPLTTQTHLPPRPPIQSTTTITFHQPFPTPSTSTGPSHPPTTYATATANNLLTDNASILTLASSSKQRRRRSFDTDASIRAMAPSSLWGGSRESLPLSVLSANLEAQGLYTSMGEGSGSSTGPGTTATTAPGRERGSVKSGFLGNVSTMFEEGESSEGESTDGRVIYN